MKEILLVFVAVVVTDVAAAAAAAAVVVVVESVVVAKQQLNSVVVAAHWIGFANAVSAVVVVARAAVQLHYLGLGFEFVTVRITVVV